MRANWRECSLGDIARIKHGYAFKGEFFGSTGTHVVLTPGNFNEAGGFKEKADKAKWYSGPVPDGYVLDAGDLIVAMTEQGEGLLGSSALVPRSGFYLHNQRLGLVTTANAASADRLFLYYLFNSRSVRQQIRASANGAKIRHTSPARIYEVKVCIPDISTQRRIASILSAYDDLIDNNTRRIAILEEMARRIYEEWFVRFRFPGHEGVRMVESELGLVPEGWQAKVIGDVAAYINRGLAPNYDDLAEYVVLNQKCIRDQRLSLKEARRQSKPVPPEKLVRVGDVLINSTGVGTLGRVAQVLAPLSATTVDTHVTIVRPGFECVTDFFGLSLLSLQSHFEAQGVGSTGQTELSRTRIAEAPIVVPPHDLQVEFAALVRPMRLLTVTLLSKNENLRTTRDLLLPKLISGELDVSTVPEPDALAA